MKLIKWRSLITSLLIIVALIFFALTCYSRSGVLEHRVMMKALSVDVPEGGRQAVNYTAKAKAVALYLAAAGQCQAAGDASGISANEAVIDPYLTMRRWGLRNAVVGETIAQVSQLSLFERLTILFSSEEQARLARKIANSAFNIIRSDAKSLDEFLRYAACGYVNIRDRDG